MVRFVHSTRWKFRYNKNEDASELVFDGMAFKGTSEYGVKFFIQIYGEFLSIHTEPRRSGYLLTDSFSAHIKGILGDPELGPSVGPGGKRYSLIGEVLITNWALPEDKREEVIREVEQFLKSSL